jgi:hypothetical protein
MVENYKKWFTVLAGLASLGEVASTADDLRPLPLFFKIVKADFTTGFCDDPENYIFACSFRTLAKIIEVV